MTFVFLAAASLLPAQSTASPQEPSSQAVPTFRANSRLVQLDVVVLDGNGHPVPGLKAADFSVLEDGKMQHVRSFDAHQQHAAEAAKPFDLPPHQYTNVPEQESTGPMVVVLFDTLNTPVLDQVTARQHMLEFLKTLPDGQSTALFVLGTRLRMVQSFTGKSEVLVAAAGKLLSGPSPLLVTEADRQSQEDNLIYRERIFAPAAIGGISGASNIQTSNSLDVLAEATQKLRDALTEQERTATTQRVGITLESMTELASMLRGYPGRKNLLWLSAAFPFSFGPNPLMRTEDRDTGRFDLAVHQTTTLLSAAQVAVYPIDVSGIRAQGVDLSSSGEGASGVDSGTGVSRLNTAYARQLQEETDAHATMDEIAEQTGGKAYYGNNDLKSAMRRSLDQGATYYTLSYAPQNQDWNGKFRRINIKLAHASYRLQYRRGYYALPESEHSPGDSTRKLAGALRPDMPDSTALYVKAEVLPPDSGHQSVRITYLIDPQQVTFTDLPDGRKHAFVDLLAVVWDDHGKDVGHAANTIDATLDPKQYQQVLRSGLQAAQEVRTQPGAYRVRLGAVDRISQQVGTIDVVLAH
jgi:VWFA-related protein